MEPKLTRVVIGIVACIVALMAWDLIASPADAVRAELAAELARVPERAPVAGAGDQDFAALLNPVLTKPNLWREIVAAPPAPPAAEAKPPAAAGPSAPDLAVLLKGLVMRPGQIGDDKMKVAFPDRPDGTWMAIGDTFNGCVLESFTREEAVFRYDWKEGGEVLRKRLPRPQR